MNSVSQTTTAVLQETRTPAASVSARATISFLILVLLGVLSKGVGLLREMVLAAQFGASGAMDAYLAAQTLPSAAQRVFDELLGASLLPLFAGWCLAAGEISAWKQLKRLVRSILFWSSLLIAAGMLLAGPLVRVLAPGLGEEEKTIAARALAILLPGVACAVAGSIFAALLSYHRRFVCAALFALAGNALALVSILVFAKRIGVYSAAAGVTAGALLLLLQWFFLPAESRATPTAQTDTAARGEFLRLAGPLAAGIVLFNLAPLIQNFLASLLPEGSIALLNYAFKVNWLAYLVLVVPITTMVFPRLADAGAARDTEKFLGALHLALKATWLALLPAMIFLSIAAPAVIALLYERGSFTTVHTAGTAAILRVFLLGLPGASATLILFYALYALKETTARVSAGALVVVVYALFGWILTRQFGVRGIALTLVINFTALTVLLSASLRRILGHAWWKPLLPFLLRSGLAGGLAALVFYVLGLAGARLLPLTTPAWTVCWLMTSFAASTAVFVCTCAALGISEMTMLLQECKRAFLSGAKSPAGGFQ
ncbi:MAG: hypothetical protein M1453_11460 [Acidobacteria bacterium]|nr:hypothetical protein [Acidobacteriota bacterium]